MSTLRNKKILVTGGAGFIGSHLVKRLIDEGAKVTVIVKYNSIIDCPRLVKVWDKINVLEADLRNTDSVSEMKNYNEYRHFLYGSFTLLAKKNIHLKKSLGSLPTDYNLLD